MSVLRYRCMINIVICWENEGVLENKYEMKEIFDLTANFEGMKIWLMRQMYSKAPVKNCSNRLANMLEQFDKTSPTFGFAVEIRNTFIQNVLSNATFLFFLLRIRKFHSSRDGRVYKTF